MMDGGGRETIERPRQSSLSGSNVIVTGRSRQSSVSNSGGGSNNISSSSNSGNNGWEPNHSTSKCNSCPKEFGFIHRKHHCRSCGLVFCQKCSSLRVELPGQSQKSRVCGKCFPKILASRAPPMNSFIHSKAWVPRGVFAQMLSYLSHTDLCLVSMACRWWYKRSSLDLQWRPLYHRHFGKGAIDSSESFHRRVNGIDFDSLPWKKKFSVRWAAKRAAEKEKNFEAMSSLLESIDLAKYSPIFQAEEIDVESLCLMNAGHLRDLGIPAGPIMKLLNVAACLAENGEEDEEDEGNGSLTTDPVTPAYKYKQRRMKVKQYKANLVRRVQQSIVRIAVLTADGGLCNVGSGIIVHEKGLIATARHCLVGEGFDCINRPNESIIVVAPTETASRPPLWKYQAKAIPNCAEEELDFALLWLENEVVSDPPSGLYIGDVTERTIARNWDITNIEGSGFGNLGKLPAVSIGNSNNMDPGDEMWMFGYPSSGHNTITVHHAICSGTDSQIYDGKEVGKAMLRSAAQLDNGFSGGAAVDKKGQLVGLISFSVLRQDRVRAINMIKGAIEIAKSERL